MDSIDSLLGSQLSKSLCDIGKKLALTVEDEEIYQRYRTNIRHNIENGETILDRFSCAIKQKILIQGHLYISTEALYFFSPHNDETAAKFFSMKQNNQTKIKISMDQIGKISKVKNLMFDNSIEIDVQYLNQNFNENNPF